jgi:predicted transcriptional regulator
MELVASFWVTSVVRAPLGMLWQSVSDVAGITRREFDAYFEGLEFGVSIRISGLDEFPKPVPLSDLRTIWRGFHPPQGFRYLDAGDVALLQTLNQCFAIGV